MADIERKLIDAARRAQVGKYTIRLSTEETKLFLMGLRILKNRHRRGRMFSPLWMRADVQEHSVLGHLQTGITMHVGRGETELLIKAMRAICADRRRRRICSALRRLIGAREGRR